MKTRGGHRCFFGILMMLILVTPAVAQVSPVDQTAATSTGNQGEMSPFSIYSPFVSGINLQQMYNRFLDAYIDPNQYIVGPGDGFSILFTSGDIPDISCEINSDGSLFIKSVGRYTLSYVTLREALDKIHSEVARVFTKSDFSVQMSAFRVSRINVIGEVARPGIYYAPAIWGASEVLSLAGGVTARASLRNIKLTGFGSDIPVDLVRFALLGDRRFNPMVCKGNLLVVPDGRAGVGHVTVAGAVDKPGTFEYAVGDRLSDLIAFGGGAPGDMADIEVVVSNGGLETARVDGASSTLSTHELQPGDNVRLVWKKDRRNFGMVDITGAVMRPGRYPLGQEHITLKNLLQVCGGASEDACPELIQVFRINPDDRGREILVSLDQSESANTSQTIAGGGNAASSTRLSLNPRLPQDPDAVPLADGDSVFVPRATGMVTVSGAVAAPGLVPYRKGEKVEYYLQQVGGLGFDGDRDRMVVINTLTGGRITAAEAGTLFDGEILYVPRKESQTKP